MSGVAGIARYSVGGVGFDTLGRMAAAIRHRGPDGYGFYTDERVGLAHLRLSIVDIRAGAQPLTNEDGQIVVTYNGEIYNHLELRRDLEERGHLFRTRCDTEVLVHGYEEWGPEILERLNGQFAFAIYDRRKESVFIARDRFGICPLFYAQRNGDLYFGSEIKAILASGEIDAAVDPRGFDEVLTFCGARPPRTPFSGIAALEPGTYGIWKDGALWLRSHYELDYPEADEEPIDVVEQLDEIMLRSVGMKMRGDVPVGAYLSGGLDSSIMASLAGKVSADTLRSFSITFDDPRFDESEYQREMAEVVGSIHSGVAVGHGSISQSFPQVMWHAETPVLGTAAVPMYHLAKLTKESGIKVVLTGDGADELFLGYDLFKELSVRRFSLGAGEPIDPLFSHLPRFLLNSRIKDFYTAEFKAHLGRVDVIGELRASLPTRFFGWSPLNQASYLEMTTLLSPYLLSSQGDRMSMAHGVEGRFPFLDRRLFEFAAALPTGSRLRGLREKEVLRRWATRVLPHRINARRKQPYRAPDSPSFFGPGSPDWIGEVLSPDAVHRVGIFAPAAVSGLVKRCRSGLVSGVPENQAIVGILSAQLWHGQFIERDVNLAPLPLRGASVVLTHTMPADSASRSI